MFIHSIERPLYELNKQEKSKKKALKVIWVNDSSESSKDEGTTMTTKNIAFTALDEEVESSKEEVEQFNNELSLQKELKSLRKETLNRNL